MRPMRTAGVTLGLVSIGAVACTLVTSTGGLTGGEPYDAGVDATAPAPDASDASDASSASSTYFRAVMDDKPVIYLRLDDKAGPACADEISTSSHALFAGNIGFGGPGIFADGTGHGVSLLDAKASITIPDDTSKLDFPGLVAFTLEAWIAPATSNPRGTAIYSNMGTSPSFGIGSGLNMGFFEPDGVIRSERWVDSVLWFYAEGPTTIRTGEFSHLVLTFDGENATQFVNGQGGPGRPRRGDAGKANQVPITWGGFVGAIDEIAIYDKALSPGAVITHYLARSSK